MRLVIRMFAILAAFLIFATMAFAQGNPRGASKLTVSGKAIAVEYGRPSLKGRSVETMLGQLKPGDVWRLGADQSTTFSTELDLTFGDVTVPKGTYSLWARRESGGWKLVFNKQHGQWGTEHDAAQDLAAVPLAEAKAAQPAEQVTIDVTKTAAGGAISIEWGDMKLSTEFQAK